MVSSRQRSSLASDSTKTKQQTEEELTVREKLCLASLAVKYNNSWNAVAKNITSLVEKDRPDGWLNQRACASQFDKLMSELSVERRPKRTESSEGNSSLVTYKKIAQKRIQELEEEVIELRNQWVSKKQDLINFDKGQTANEKLDISVKNIKVEKQASKTSTPAAKPGEPEKQTTRAVTRRESSRQNLEKTLATLCKEAAEYKNINIFKKPSTQTELEIYDRFVLKHVDFNTVKAHLDGEVEDPHAILSDLLLMFQNFIMFYPPEHSNHVAALDLRQKMVPHWEKALLDRFRMKH